MVSKAYVDEKGYWRDRYGNLIHRQIAYEKWKSNREAYPLPFSKYDIHHTDGNKTNNDPSNLQLLTREDHKVKHGLDDGNKRLKEYLSGKQKDLVWPRTNEEETEENIKIAEKRRKAIMVKERIAELRWEGAGKKLRGRLLKNSKFWVKTLILLLISVVIFRLVLLPTTPQNFDETPLKTITVSNPLSEIEPLIVEGSKTEVIITNNQDRVVSVNVTYRIFSNWFGIDNQVNKIFEVGPNQKQIFEVYKNAGCDTAPCSVSIIDFRES